MDLVIDCNLSPDWAQALAAKGYRAQHWTRIGDPRASDAQIMAWAREHQAVVLTADLDFSDLLAAGLFTGPSVIQLRADDLAPSALLLQVVAAIEQFTAELRSGALLSIDPAKARARLLPLR